MGGGDHECINNFSATQDINPVSVSNAVIAGHLSQ
jgi:hypothetical protein